MAVPDTKGFRVKNNNETGISKIATEAILDKAVTKAKLSQPVQTEINKIANKADQDGDYDSLTAGGAKQLLSTVYVDDNEPYNFRTAGGSADIGDRMYEEVVGGTVVWNQLMRGLSADYWQLYSSSYASVSFSDGVASLTILQATASGRWQQGIRMQPAYPTSAPVGHKFLVTVAVNPSVDCAFGGEIVTSSTYVFGTAQANTWTTLSAILVSNKPTTYGLIFPTGTLNADDTYKLKNYCVFDLTQMFGSTIADYIYSLEQGTAGAGVAWFRKLFPKPYYEYNAGELMSVKAGSHDTVGFNAWDEEWEVGYIASSTGNNASSPNCIRSKNYFPVCPNATYYLNAPNNARLYYYDSDKHYMEGDINVYAKTTFVVPTGASYMRFFMADAYGATYKNDICINLSWDGERNGEYEPYEKHTYPLDELELRGIPKLDANNQLYYDGDTYASDGTVTRKYGIVDLGTLSWTYNSSNNRFQSAASGAVGWAANVIANAICSHYQTVTFDSLYIGGDGVLAFDATNLRIRDTRYTDAATFKTAMSGVYLVYELAEPTTETADTFVNPQVVDDFGTEEHTDYAVEAGDRDVAIPVGHNSQYMNNLRAKLEMAPDSPSGDGKYIVQQSNGENAYIPYTADGRLDAIEAKLPAPPSENGTYKLTVTVTDGGVTYTWVAG